MLPRDLCRTGAVVGVALAAVVGLVPASGADTAASERPCAAVEVIAHRGLHDKRHTEDTLAAFSQAIDHGVTQIEGDLRLSADGSWVFLHDSTLGRTTHGRGAVHDLPDSYLAGVRNNDHNVGLTFLPAALDLLSQRPGVTFEIEIKPSQAPADRLQVLLGMLAGYGVSSRALLTSRSTTVLDAVRQMAPAVQTGLITRNPQITPAVAASYGATLILGAYASRPPLVAAMRTAGLRVESWTIDHRRQFRKVVRSRSNAVITDDVRETRSWCARR